MNFLLVPALLFSLSAASQTPVSVKTSPASDALVKAAQELQTEQKAYDTALLQARTTLDSSQKALQADLQKANADLLSELKADKKYKDKLAAIDILQKNAQTSSQTADQKFQQESGPIQNEIYKDKAIIEGLTPVVRQENNLPSTAYFDVSTQKWSKVEDKPAESKK